MADVRSLPESSRQVSIIKGENKLFQTFDCSAHRSVWQSCIFEKDFYNMTVISLRRTEGGNVGEMLQHMVVVEQNKVTMQKGKNRDLKWLVCW